VSGHGAHDEDHHHHHEEAHDHDGLQPTVFSLRTPLHFGAPLAPAQVRTALAAFCRALVDGLAARGCRLIGHVKGVLEAGASGTQFFNLTTFDAPPRFNGELAAAVASYELTINAIVFFVDRDAVEACVHDAIRDHLGGACRRGVTGETERRQ
jgi:hypothetical protein